MALVSASLLAADFSRFGEGLKAIEQAGAQMVHIDVCDGHFSPGITAGAGVVARVRKSTRLPLDVHLQIERPERFIGDFVKAGSDRLALHPGSTSDLYRAVHQIRAHGAEAGVVLNPAEPVELISDLAAEIDFLTVLEAGEEPARTQRTDQKVNDVLSLRRDRNARFAVQVEGEIQRHRAGALAAAGVGVIVTLGRVGTTPEMLAAVQDLVGLVAGVRDPFAVEQGV